MNYETVESYRAAMDKLAQSIQKKANKLLLAKTELNDYQIEVTYCKGWFGGDDQIEDKMVISLFFNSKRVETITISPYRGTFGKINLMDDFIDNYNKKKNIKKSVKTLFNNYFIKFDKNTSSILKSCINLI
jgi:hypothetical protein